MENSHKGSGSSHHGDNALQSGAAFPQSTKKTFRRSGLNNESTKGLVKSQRNGVNGADLDSKSPEEEASSTSNATLQVLQQAQMLHLSAQPASKVDGVVALAAIKHQVAEGHHPANPPKSIEGSRSDMDVKAIKNTLLEGAKLNFSGLGSGGVLRANPAANIPPPSEAMSPAASQVSNGAIFAAQEINQERTWQITAPSTSESESEHEGLESETEPGAESSEEGFSASETNDSQIVAEMTAEGAGEGQEGERQDVVHEGRAKELADEIEADAEVASIMSMAEAGEVEVVAEAAVNDDAGAEVASVMLPQREMAPQEAELAVEDARLELMQLQEGLGAAPIPPLKAIELKEEAKEEVIVHADAQELNNQQEQEKRMSKLFELPHITPEQQREINTDIKYAFGLIDEGEQQLKAQEERGLIIFGKSKSGKSTLANMLAGRELTATKKAKGWEITLSTPEAQYEGAAAASGRGSPVGNNIYRSETQIPHKSTVGGTAIIDVPGFFDTKGFSIDAAHEILYTRALKNTANLKLVLVVAQNTIDSPDEQYARFINQITPFAKIFANIEAIKGSIVLVVSKVDHDRTAEDFKTIIQGMFQDNPKIQNDQQVDSEGALVRKVLESVQDSVMVFHKPQQAGTMARELELKDFDSLAFTTAHHAKSPPAQVDADAAAIPVPPSSPASSIVSSSFLTGADAIFMEKYKQQAEITLQSLQEKIKVINSKILRFFQEQLALNNQGSPDSNPVTMHQSKSFIHKPLLQKGDPNPSILSELYKDLEDLLPDSYHKVSHPEEDIYLGSYNTDTHFLKLHHTSCILKEALQHKQGKSDGQKLIDVLRILKNLCDENEHSAPEDNPGATQKSGDEQKEADGSSAILLSKQIGGCIHLFKRLVEFEEFCRKLCGAGQQPGFLTDTVGECTTLVNSIFTGAMNDLITAPKEFHFSGDVKGTLEYDYRRKMLQWLERAPDQKSAQVIEAKALNHYHMGLICHKQKDDEEGAMVHYSQTLSLNKEMEDLKRSLLDQQPEKSEAFNQGVKNTQGNLGAIYLEQAEACQEEIDTLKMQRATQKGAMAHKNLLCDVALPGLPEPQASQASKDAAVLYSIDVPGHKLRFQKPLNIAEQNVSIMDQIKAQTQQMIQLYNTAADLFEAADDPVNTQTCLDAILQAKPRDKATLKETLVKKGDHFTKYANPSEAQKAYTLAYGLCEKDSDEQDTILKKAFDAARVTTTPEGLAAYPAFKALMAKDNGHTYIFSSPHGSQCPTPLVTSRLPDSSGDNSPYRSLSPPRKLGGSPLPATPESPDELPAAASAVDHHLQPSVIPLAGAVDGAIADMHSG